MPSYRRDRPGPQPSPRPRREMPRTQEPEEEEERGFRRPSLFRREGAPSEFASRPVGPVQRRELWEVLVPESEQRDPYYNYDVVWSVLPGARRSAAAVPPPPPRGVPPQEESRRPARESGAPPTFDARDFFDLERVWNAATTLRQDSRFRPGSPVAVVRLAPEQDFHRLYKIQPADVKPFLDELSYAINFVKPREFSGRFFFQTGKDGFVWLAYVE